MVLIAQLIAKIICEGEAAIPAVKQAVLELCKKFPLYENTVNE